MKRSRRPASGLFAGEAGEEFGGVAQLLDVEPEPVAVVGAGLADMGGVAAHLAPLPLELAGGEPRHVAPGTLAEAPAAGFDPERQPQHQRARPLRPQRRFDAVIGLGPRLDQPRAEQPVALAPSLAGKEDVEVARVAELRREPAQLLAQVLIILAADGRPEQRKGRAQPPERDPRLVQRVGIAFARAARSR